MKKIASLIAFIILIATLSSALAQCHGKFQKRYDKGDTIVVPCTDMVLLNMPTFETYYLANKNLENIKQTLPKYQQVIDSLESEGIRKSKDYKSIIENKTKAMALESMSKNDALNQIVKLENDNSRLRKHGKFKTIGLTVLGGFAAASLINSRR